MDNGGWIRLYRKFKEWGWYGDNNVKILFIEILLTANYEEREWLGKKVKRGEIVTSIKHLSENAHLSEQQVRSSLSKLKSTGELTIKTTNKYSIITVNKYNEYQEITSKPTNEQQTNNKQLTTTKEYKNIKKREDVAVKKVYTPPNLNEKDFIYVAQKYKVPIDFVRFQYDKMFTWAESNPTNPRLKGRNWRMTLMTFVRDDSLKIKTDYAKQNSDLAL